MKTYEAKRQERIREMKYKCNGQTFNSYDAVVTYCKANNFRIVNTETFSFNLTLITVVSSTEIQII